MKSIFFVQISLLALLLGFLPSLSSSEFNRDDEFQIWFYHSFKKEYDEKTKVYFETEFRWGDDASTLYLYYLQSGVRYSPCRWLEIGPAYRQTYSLRLEDRKWIPIYSPLLDVTFLYEGKKWAIKNRSRTQYLIHDPGPKAWLYRNRTLCKTSLQWGKVSFEPFIYDEIFIREREDFSQNRLAFGLKSSFFKGCDISLAYILRHQKIVEQWRKHHVLDLLVEITF